MTIPQIANDYAVSVGTSNNSVGVPFFSKVNPSSSNIQFPQGKRWVNTVLSTVWELASFSSSNGTLSANWVSVGGGSTEISTLTGDSGGAISPASGNVNLLGTANQITTIGSGSTITASLIGPYTPATYTAHGVLVGEGASSIVATAVGATGTVLAGGGASADPSFSATPSLTSITLASGSALGTYVDGGTFTPTILFNGAGVGVTYSTQVGAYVKIGKLLFFTINIILTSKGSSTGAASLGGLPFASATTAGNYFYTPVYGSVTLDTGRIPCAEIGSNANTISLLETSAAITAPEVLINTAFANTSQIYLTGFYQTTL